MVLTGKVCQPGRKALGRMLGRSPRSVGRSIAALVSAGYISRRRRGKKLTNVYRLTKALWARLTNHQVREPRQTSRPTGMQMELRAVLDRLSARFAPGVARGAPLPA
jgi:DNA-binding MarR family transcriptional regulator